MEVLLLAAAMTVIGVAVYKLLERWMIRQLP